MPGGVAARPTDDHSRRHLGLLLERPQLVAVFVQKPFGGTPRQIRERWRHGGAGEIGRRPELDLGGRHVDPQVRTQPLLHPVNEQPANVIKVHVGQHHVGHRPEIDAGGPQSVA
jgi:hypothetical protein